ncbi:MAG TPA: rhomboid family intramembrane serine protease [Candidatus Sulfotelmatobacter sp.]|jgi:membrane associated rhomboid family serine protease|nr:rhomboid family intramembrane serine protease [Candidatus Sulfotelmatobacter sp.]
MTLSLPPFTKAVTWLLGINTGIFLFMLVLPLLHLGILTTYISYYCDLTPIDVVHGKVWQLVTYSVLHEGLLHLLGNMLGIWMFGSAIESAWGTRRFLELYWLGVVGAALTTVALSYSHMLGDPTKSTIGASGGVFAILIAFGMLFGDQEIMMIPFPFLIKAKYFVGILIVVTLALAMGGGGHVAYVAHLGGLFFGWLYVRRGPKAALVKVGLSERFYGMKNSYYRWKRRRAAKKFEVYMRKTENRQVHFDEHGNYIPPDDDPRKGNGGGKSGWVN